MGLINWWSQVQGLHLATHWVCSCFPCVQLLCCTLYIANWSASCQLRFLKIMFLYNVWVQFVLTGLESSIWGVVNQVNTYIHKCKDLWVATLPFQLSTLKSTLKKPVYPIDDHVSRAFLCAMVSLIGCYRDALRLKTVSMMLQKFILPQCFCFFH